MKDPQQHLQSLVIITGMSGSGKHSVFKVFEDMVYFCVDNLPPSLIPRRMGMPAVSGGKITKLAIVIDVRLRESLSSFRSLFGRLKHSAFRTAIVFVDALDDVLARRVAPKIMHPHPQDEFALVERFRDEARFAAQLVHPNIVTVHDYVDDDGLSCLVMEFAPGGTVMDRLAGAALSGPELVLVGQQVCDALVSAHELGIVHRDIKPANIMYEPESDQVKVTDFGIARITDSSKTKTGMVLGLSLIHI